MPEQTFRFKQFTVQQDKCAMKVGTDGVLLGAWAQIPAKGRILDIGTGTGLIALIMAQRCDAFIDAIEIDAEAAEQAKENFIASPWKERLNLYHTSLQEYWPPHKYDLIVSNPPYFGSAKGITTSNRKLARHSLHLSLEELIGRSLSLLNPGGSIAVIIPSGEEGRLLAAAKGNNLYPHRMLMVKGTHGAKVKRVLIQLGREEKEYQSQELVIENSRLVFTEEYKGLTKDYYLAF